VTHLIFPLASSLLYVVAAMFLKQAGTLGSSIWRTALVCNWVTAGLFLSLWPLGGEFPGWGLAYEPVVVGGLFVGAQLLTFLALKSGDVSVATPVMGCKVVLVALFTTVVGAGRVAAPLWIAAVLSVVGIACLNRRGGAGGGQVGRTAWLALAAASCYALFDVLVMTWSPDWGAGRFLPLTMVFSGLLSLGFIPLARSEPRLSRQARRALAGGATFIALQALLLVSTMALFGDATAVNVIYSTRGLWSVLVVWWLGHWFDNSERASGVAAFRARLLGAGCLCAAVGLVFV
jgi:drug/metabolite transporter (DMT)-like permease